MAVLYLKSWWLWGYEKWLEKRSKIGFVGFPDHLCEEVGEENLGGRPDET